LRCYLGWHSWLRLRTDDGQWYKKCRSCRKFANIGSTPPPPIAPP
jgi:hypothetical protein